MNRRVTIAALIAAISGAWTMSAIPMAAAAAESGALVSLDGVTFEESPAGSLFPDGLILVPGSTHSGTFWVRNDSGRAADLRISVSDTTASNAAFIENLMLQASTPDTDESNPVALEQGATCMPLLEGEVMQAHSITEVSITLAMRDTVNNGHQGATANTTLLVSLSDPAAPSPARDCTPGGGIPLTPAPDLPADGDDAADDTDARHPADDADAGSGGGTAGEDSAETGALPDGEPSPSTTPTTDSPVGAAAPPSIGGGSPVLFPWMSVGAAVLGAGVFFGIRKRKEHRG